MSKLSNCFSIKNHKTAEIIILLMFFIFSIFQPSYADDNPPLPTPVGRVVWVQGSLKAVMANKEERLLQKASVIYLDDTLITDDKSKAQIVFTDNTLLTFRPSTTFHIDQYQYNAQAKTKSAGKYVMSLIEGGFRTITGLIAKHNPPDYRVNTPVATIGVRGTDYAVYINKGELYIGYYSGSPCVDSKKGSLCLNEKTKYAYVPSATAAPVPLSEQPQVFKEKLDVIPTKISPFTGGGGGSGGNTSAGTPTGPKGGVYSSFCISQ